MFIVIRTHFFVFLFPTGFAQNFTMLLAGRVVTGLYVGITSVAVPTYIGEYASPDIRGAVGDPHHFNMQLQGNV